MFIVVVSSMKVDQVVGVRARFSGCPRYEVMVRVQAANSLSSSVLSAL